MFGAEKVFILAGGLPRWKAEGRALEAGQVCREPRSFQARKADAAVAALAQVRSGLEHMDVQVIDARPADRFRGEAPEPRPGLRSGHMPGSLNVPFTALIENGTLRPPDRLREAFKAGGVASTSRPSPAADRASRPPSCGSPSMRSAASRKPSTTAPGRNGARGRPSDHAVTARDGQWRIWLRNSLVRSCWGCEKNAWAH